MSAATRFCTISLTRSGSTWFSTLLASHPGVRADMELFLPHAEREDNEWLLAEAAKSFYRFRQSKRLPRPLSTFSYFRYLHREAADAPACGFKIMIRDLARNPEAMLALITCRYRFIFLTRNPFDAAISRYVSQASGVSQSASTIELEKISVDPVRLLRDVRWRLTQVRIARALLRALPNPSIEVAYEALVADRDTTMRTVFTFLRVDPTHRPASPLKKIVDRPYRDVIGNYEEVVRFLQRENLASYISAGDRLA